MRVPEKQLNVWKQKFSRNRGLWYMDETSYISVPYEARSGWTLKSEASVAAANIRKQKRQARVKKTSLGWTVFAR